MLAVLHDPAADPDRRDRMAIAAAPFIHPRLSAVDANVRTQVEEASTLTEAERRERARQAIAEAFAERRDPEQWQASGPVLRLVAPADDAAPPPDEAG
jgi:hypothetical protein